MKFRPKIVVISCVRYAIAMPTSRLLIATIITFFNRSFSRLRRRSSSRRRSPHLSAHSSNDMPNVKVEMREAIRVDTSRRVVVMSEGGELPYDILVVATGARTSYFGHESEWAQHALGLKSLPDAIAARNRLLKAFERADMESDPVKQAREMTVVVVGGGADGCRNHGNYQRVVQRTLCADFRNLDLGRAHRPD